MIRFLINLFKRKKSQDYKIEREIINEHSKIVTINANKRLSGKEIIKIIKDELNWRNDE